jgi:2-polyprenyl-6-methoxyphenol hydroxylase-like FAD-dependent oxidoreductase
MSMKVAIVGAGVGGLCLAQGLRRAGIAVQVFEQEAGPHRRDFPLRLDFGIRSLARCLRPELIEVFQASCTAAATAGAIFDSRLVEQAPWVDAATPAWACALTNRLALNELLMTGLADIVHFGQRVLRVDDLPDRVRLHLAGGGGEVADLLVAADGVDSVVRRQVLPAAEVVDTGLRGICGRVERPEDLLSDLPPSLVAGPSPVIGPDGLTLQFSLHPPSGRLTWTLVGPTGAVGPADPGRDAADPGLLQAIACRLTAHWHPLLDQLLARSDAAATFAFPLRAALPVPAWPTTRVTLLGDAVHATAALCGTGAGVTIRDAALLSDELTEVASGRTGLLAAVSRYEEQMREYGGAAALRSLQRAEHVFRAYIPALG